MKDFKFTSVDPRQLQQNLRRFPFFEDMVNRSLEVFLVSPLLNFSFNELFLNRISNEFTKHLQKEFKGVEGALLLSSKPPRLPCVSVIVVDNVTPLFSARMMSFSSTTEGPHTRLPLMCRIINKKVSLGNSIVSFLEKRFCCAIKSCELTDMQFQWLMGIAINETLTRGLNDGITITHGMDGTQAAIHFTLEPESLEALWVECLHCGSGGVNLDWNSVASFVLAVNDHFLNTFKWNNINMPVERVVVDGVSIARLKTLRLKVSNGGIIFVLLKFVDEIKETKMFCH
ncbi:hypothetical protein GE061_001328 [Apolygus lucorum]|uniref:Uncharacterized protein n=1 Tax=Apolygus lucorum TaxID=248454 RepID=A0A6A4IYM1_APOLU|nr:hypothetical protein GE061_001328 [Apolygus lucorum]